MGDRVAVITGDGKFGTIDEQHAHEIERTGGRVLTKKQADEYAADEAQKQAAAAKDEAYSKLSGVDKASGYIQTGIGVLNPLALAGATRQAPPIVQSFGAGTREGLTAGLADVAEAKAAKLYGGAATERKVVAEQDEIKAAHPTLHTAGNIFGTVAGASLGEAPGAGAATALPSAGIARVGGAIEGGVGRALSGLAGRGALGEAALGAAKIGARGAFEAGAYAGIQEASNEALHDPEMSASKIFAAVGMGSLLGAGIGSAVGGGTSLARSGLRSAFAKEAAKLAPAEIPRLGSSLDAGLSTAAPEATQALQQGERVSSDVFRADGEIGAKGAHEVRLNPDAFDVHAPEASANPIAIPHAAPVEATPSSGFRGTLNDWADEQAFKSLSYGGLQPTKYVKMAERYLPRGTKDGGKWLIDNGIRDANASLFRAGLDGTPEKTLAKIEAAHAADTTKLVNYTDKLDVQIKASDIRKNLADVIGKYDQSAATKPIAQSLQRFADELGNSLGLRTLDDTAKIQDVLRERKALDKLVFHNNVLDPSLMVEAKRELRGALEGSVMDALDASSGKAPGEEKAIYKELKKNYAAGSMMLDLAEDSAARAQKNAMFGHTATQVGGALIAGGHGAAALGGALATKTIKERGNAVAAVALSKLAKSDILAKMIGTVDTKIDNAARGLLLKPAKGLIEAPEGSPQARAATVMRRIAELQANPDAVADHVATETDDIADTHPEIASAISTNMTRGVAFLASKVPVDTDPDPLNPHELPALTDVDAARLARYGWYVEKPDRFFDELKRGKLTYEGAETAQELCGPAFVDLQTKMGAAMATHIARDQPIPYQQKVKIGDVLGFAAVPEQRLDLMQRLQQNAVNSTQSTKAMANGGKRSAPVPTQSSVYDRLEGGGKQRAR